MKNEPVITINGVTLTEGMSMTVRVALESFYSDLSFNGLGDDEHGKKMVEGYQTNIKAMRKLMGYG